jgi:LTXXQ motif family protein
MNNRWTMIPLAVACAASLAAQQPDTAKPQPHPGMAMPMMMRHPAMEMGGMGDSAMDQLMGAMMASMIYMPQHLVAWKDTLQLTADQLTRLNAIAQRAKTAHDAALAAAKPHLTEMSQATDSAAMKHHFTAAHDAMGQAHWAMLSAAAQAKAVLTPAQRTQVQALADSMHARMRAQHPDMMERHN